jgi:hypothetical protein
MRTQFLEFFQMEVRVFIDRSKEGSILNRAHNVEMKFMIGYGSCSIIELIS